MRVSGLPIAIGFNHELSQPCDILLAAPLGRWQVDREENMGGRNSYCQINR